MVGRRLVLFAVIALLVGMLGTAPPALAGHTDEDFDFHLGGIVTGAGVGGGPHVRLFTGAGDPTDVDFFAFDPAFRGGVFVGAADIDGDNWVNCCTGGAGTSDDGEHNDEIIVGAGPGGGPHVKVFGVTSTSDTEAVAWETPVSFLAYAPTFTGGVRVAGGDLDRVVEPFDKRTRDEIVTGPGPGGGPNIKVFDAHETLGLVTETVSFMAFSPAYTGGVWVGVTDIQSADSPGSLDEAEPGVVVVGAGIAGASEVRGFDKDGALLFSAHMFSSSANPTGGVKVAGRQQGPFWARVVTGTGPGSDPLVNVAGWAGLAHQSFFAYDPGFRGGVNVGLIGGPGGGRIITGAGPGGGPHVKSFARVHEPEGLEASFFAYAPTFPGGVNVAGGEFFCDSSETSCATLP